MNKRTLSWANLLPLVAILLAAGFQPAGNCQGVGKAIRPPRTRTLVAHSDVVSSLAFSPDGRLVASGSQDGTIKLWDVGTGKVLRTLKDETSGQALAFFPDGKTLIAGVGNEDKGEEIMHLWDVETGKLKGRWKGPTRLLEGLIFSADGKLIATADMDKTVRIWDAQTGKLKQTVTGYDYTTSVAFSPDGKLVVSGHHDAGILVWDVETGERKQTLMGGAFGEIQALAYSPDGSTLASGGHDATVKLWDARTGKLTHTLKGHRTTVTSIVFSPDGSLMASGSTDKTVKLWDARTWTLKQTFYAPNHSLVYSLAFTPDGQQLAAAIGNYDTNYGAIVMWNLGQ